ncbi:MAG: aminoacyl--tRNA ligase-related protein [Patescibacteria group bacterium]
MRYSKLFGKTNKNAPHEADSTNARFLIQGGFINQLAAGIFTYLPLGLRVLRKVQKIVRDEMDAVGGQEILMPALIPKQLFETTQRWDSIDVLFKLEGAGGKEFALGATHEEVVTPLAQACVKSYKDLPVMVYQIQDKFRNEARAKSGLLRGREFSMKDLYSFHTSQEDLEAYYDKVLEAYLKIFQRCGLDAIVAEASGGVFSKYSHEFQVATPNGEDIIYLCEDCRYAQNREIAIMKEGDVCPKCQKGSIKEVKAIEVGNIFKLSTRFSDPFDFTVTGEDGLQKPVIMGCYGIGPSRVAGSIVEVHHDERGIIWPKSVAPFDVHLVSLGARDEHVAARILDATQSLYEDFERSGIEVLWDDRDASPGEKFADADLIGIPLRLVISEKTLSADSVEWKERNRPDAHLVPLVDVKKEAKLF